jgi:WhiB family redox-sensing transcriptional regulator
MIPSTSEGQGPVADTARLPEPLVAYWEWQTAAACRGMDSSLFFHPPKERKTAKAKRITTAKAICHDCPARQDCAAHALRVREPYGVWGGLSEDERAELLGLESLKYPQKINAARE